MRGKKSLLVLLGITLSTSVSLAGLISITADTDDQSLTSTGSTAWVGQANARLGTQTAGTISTLVLPFLLPDLQGESVFSASLSAYCNGPNANVKADSTVLIDLLGVRVSSSSTMLTTDYAGTILVDGAYQLNTALPAGTMTFTSATLASYIQSIYNNDVNAAGKYLFLTIAPDSPSANTYQYTEVSTANDPVVANQPVLSITTVIPEPATIGMLGLGALITLLIRRMKA